MDHRRLVGEWIEVRLGQLGMTAGELAQLVGVRPATVYNAVGGKTKITPSDHGRWEATLKWRSGSLTRAYRDGVEPVEAAELEVGGPGRPLTVGGDPEWTEKTARLNDHGRSILGPLVDELLANQDRD